jgi:hypothetical protein
MTIELFAGICYRIVLFGGVFAAGNGLFTKYQADSIV